MTGKFAVFLVYYLMASVVCAADIIPDTWICAIIVPQNSSLPGNIVWDNVQKKT